MKRKIKEVVQGVFFLVLMVFACIAGTFGIVRGVIWEFTPIDVPTCDGVAMGRASICDLTHNGTHVGSNTYDEQLSSQQISQIFWRVMTGIIVLLIVGVPFLVSSKKLKK